MFNIVVNIFIRPLSYWDVIHPSIIMYQSSIQKGKGDMKQRRSAGPSSPQGPGAKGPGTGSRAVLALCHIRKTTPRHPITWHRSGPWLELSFELAPFPLAHNSPTPCRYSAWATTNIHGVETMLFGRASWPAGFDAGGDGLRWIEGDSVSECRNLGSDPQCAPGCSFHLQLSCAGESFFQPTCSSCSNGRRIMKFA